MEEVEDWVQPSKAFMQWKTYINQTLVILIYRGLKHMGNRDNLFPTKIKKK